MFKAPEKFNYALRSSVRKPIFCNWQLCNDRACLSGVTHSAIRPSFPFPHRRDNIPKYWIWFYYLSIFKYPLTALFVNEFDSLPSTCWDVSANTPCASSQDVLAQFDMQGESFWVPTLVMVAFYIGYRVLFFLALKFRTTGMRK